MNNYYYLVASLPDLTKEKALADRSPEDVIGEILANCGSKDRALVEFLVSGYDDANLTGEFYRKAFAQKNLFLREWFRFDLNVRNAKVRYLNAALGREAGKDIMLIEDEKGTAGTQTSSAGTHTASGTAAGTYGNFDEARELEKVLADSDILARERGIDDIMWKKADELSTFHYFDVETVMGFIIKLKIIDRWLKLDEETGKEMFRKLVDEIRGTFKGFNN